MPLASPRSLFLLGFLGALTLMGVALYLEHVVGLQPCPLCIVQRICVIAFGLVCLVAVLHAPGATGRRIYAALGLLSAAAGAATAGRQVWLQGVPADQLPACLPSLEYMMEALPFQEIVRLLLHGTADAADDEGGRSKLVLYGGVGLLALALLAAGAVYYVKQRGGDESESGAEKGATTRGVEEPAVALPPDRPLRRFPGRPSKVLAQVADPHAGLSYPRLARPWQVPTKQNRLAVPGWSGQQILVTERTGGRIWYGQLLTGTLAPALRGAYDGPDSVKTVAGLAAKNHEAVYYQFPHKTAPLASQALPVGGRKGWLIASYLTYKRAGVRATGEVVATAVIDTGRPAPAVVFVSIPNTHRKLWPDVNQFLSGLKPVPRTGTA